MFNKKENMNFEHFIKIMDDRFKKFVDEEFVECTTCKAILRKKYAPKVETWVWDKCDLYFCLKCKPNYDIAYYGSKIATICGYDKPTFFKNRVEVDKNGKSITPTK